MMTKFSTALIAVTITSTALAVTPSQIYPIQKYSAASDLNSGNAVRQKVAQLVQKYNQRFSGAVIADKSEAASNTFSSYQDQIIAQLKAANAYQPLFVITDGNKLQISIFAVVDTKTKELVAIAYEKASYYTPLSKSTLRVRPFSSLIDEQTVQDAHDVSAFALGTTSQTDAKVGGPFTMKWATNVTLTKKPALAQRTWNTLNWTLSHNGGVWNAYNGAKPVKTLLVNGGVMSGVKLKEIQYK